MRIGQRVAQTIGVFGLVVFLSGMAVNPTSPVVDAVAEGDVVKLQALIADGMDVNEARPDGMTGLHLAAERGDLEVARVLLDAGADVNLVTRLGDYTPLHLAGRSGHGALVELLVEAGGDVNARTTNGATPLHLAARGGDRTAIAALLDGGADIDAKEHRWDQTPLIFAASFNRIGATELLLERGADPSATTRVLDIPARSAIDREARQVRDQVLDDYRFASENPDTWRPTPAQLEDAMTQAREVQRELLQKQAEGGDQAGEEMEDEAGYSSSWVDLVGYQGGLTPLLHAAREGNIEIARALVDGGADINRASAGDGTPPLLMAMINGHFDLGLELLARGADPNSINKSGANPLYIAINTQWAPRSRYPQQQAHTVQDADYLDVVEALLKAGADPNVQLEEHLWFMSYNFDVLRVDTRGATPFWRAAYGTDVAAMKLLLEYGADPNIATKAPPSRGGGGYGGGSDEDPSGLPPVSEGDPAVFPIHAASGVGYGEGYAANAHRHVPEGWVPAVRYLVEELGADVNARDHNGFTPLHHAAARGDVDLIEYLVSQGADVSPISRRGLTTADMANGPVQRLSPFPAARDLLLELGAPFNDNCLSC